MTGCAGWGRRGLRAATFAIVLVVSAALAHHLAGGMVPGAGTLAAAAVALGGVGWWLAARPRSGRMLAGVALAGQVALHLTFAVTMATGSTTMALLMCGGVAKPEPGLVAMHLQHSTSAAGLGTAMTLMMAAHAVGGVLVLLALRSLESTAGLVAAALRALLRAALVLLRPPATRRVTTRYAGRVAPLRSLALLDAAPRRGPPAPVCS